MPPPLLRSCEASNSQLAAVASLHPVPSRWLAAAAPAVVAKIPFFAFGLASFRAVHGGSSSLSSTFLLDEMHPVLLAFLLQIRSAAFASH